MDCPAVIPLGTCRRISFPAACESRVPRHVCQNGLPLPGLSRTSSPQRSRSHTPSRQLSCSSAARTQHRQTRESTDALKCVHRAPAAHSADEPNTSRPAGAVRTATVGTAAGKPRSPLLDMFREHPDRSDGSASDISETAVALSQVAMANWCGSAGDGRSTTKYRHSSGTRALIGRHCQRRRAWPDCEGTTLAALRQQAPRQPGFASGAMPVDAHPLIGLVAPYGWRSWSASSLPRTSGRPTIRR